MVKNLDKWYQASQTFNSRKYSFPSKKVTTFGNWIPTLVWGLSICDFLTADSWMEGALSLGSSAHCI